MLNPGILTLHYMNSTYVLLYKFIYKPGFNKVKSETHLCVNSLELSVLIHWSS